MICLPSRRTRIPAWPAPAANREPQAEAELLARKHHLKPPRSNPSHPVLSHRHDSAPPIPFVCCLPGIVRSPHVRFPCCRQRHTPSAPLRPFFAPQCSLGPASTGTSTTAVSHPQRDAAACILLACDTTAAAAARLTYSLPRLSLFETACAVYLELSPPSSHPYTLSQHVLDPPLPHHRALPSSQNGQWRRQRPGYAFSQVSSHYRARHAIGHHQAACPRTLALCPLLQRPPRSMHRIPTFLARPNIPHLSDAQSFAALRGPSYRCLPHMPFV